MSRRTERVGEQLRGDVAELLREEVSDPRVGLVTLTRVDVAPDFSNALIYWSALLGAERTREDVAEGLASAAPFLRRRLARRLQLKRTPELRFRYDPSLDLGDRTLGLLRELSDEPKTP